LYVKASWTHSTLLAALVALGCAKHEGTSAPQAVSISAPTGPKTVPEDVVEAWKKREAKLCIMVVA
jgi:hypothetical protein